jgi:uroporphyrinogen III methyltransferase/synthase
VFFERLAVHRRDARALAGRHIVADGQGAALALARHGVRADAVLDERDSLSPVESERWLVVGSPESQALTAAMLRRHGARCETPPAYSQSIPKWRADRLRELLTTRPVHAIAFTHAGEVRQLMSALDAEERRGLRRLILAVTGESTARALQEYNLIPSIIAGDRLLPEALAAAVGRGSGDGA